MKKLLIVLTLVVVLLAALLIRQSIVPRATEKISGSATGKAEIGVGVSGSVSSDIKEQK